MAVGTASYPHVAILLCTYRANRFLDQQLESIDQQSYPELSLWISTDSNDPTTEAMLDNYQRADRRIKTVGRFDGPRKGFAANFLSLLCRDEVQADYFAFCDQDDIWNEDKIEKAINQLSRFEPKHPAVYCSRTHLIDSSGNTIGYSPLFSRRPSFQNALVQSLAGGNTMVLNRAARDLVKSAGQPKVVCHDWWVYLLVTGVGGSVIYDPQPAIKYRQHDQNLIGANDSWWSSWIRLRLLLANRFKNWQDVNLEALSGVQNLLTPDNAEVLESFIRARSSGPAGRLYWLIESGVYRQTSRGNVSLFIGALFGKI